MAERPRLSVVIPAFNEEGRLPATIARVAAYLAAEGRWQPAEIIVADDGSSDRTIEAAEATAMPPGVTLRIVRLPHNRGKGAAVRAGVLASAGAQVLISDADLAAPIEELATLAARNVDLAVGSRGLRRELIERRQPLPRDVLGRAFNLAIRLLGLTTFTDTQCGFKLVEGELARRLAAVQRLDSFAFDIELLARAERAGASLAEVPVRWSHVDDSRVRALRHGAAMVLDALRVRWWLWTGQ
jgi:dolichyl-phosphate beta-glucosyltransferase